MIIQNMTNTNLHVVQCTATSGRFVGPVPSDIGTMDQVVVMTVNDAPLTGCSGKLVLQPEHASGWVVIDWTNPYIGSNSYDFSGPAGWDVFGIKGNDGADGSGNDARLAVRIEGKVAISTREPNVPLATTGPGIVRGRVLWPTSFGSPKLSLSAAMSMAPTSIGLNSGPWRFFDISALQPTEFQPYAPSGSLTATYFAGKFGEFIKPKSTGKLACSALASPVAGFDGYEFTLSNLPTGVPISINVAPVPGTTWPVPPPVRQYASKLQPTLYCVGTDAEATLTPKMQDVAGFDYTLSCEWLPQGAHTQAASRPATGSSKSVVLIGVSNASALHIAETRTVAPILARPIRH